MTGLILAAGRGSRMGKLTNEVPKCMMCLDGMPLLERQILSLKNGGCETVDLITGYKSDRLAGYGDHRYRNANWEKTNMVMTLTHASELLSRENVIVSYSDIFYSSETVAALADCQESIAISYDPNWQSLWEARFEDPLSDAETFKLDEAGNLVEIGGKTDAISEIEGQFMGLIKMTPAGWSKVQAYLGKLTDEDRARQDMTTLLSGLINTNIKIGTVPVKGPWGECDDAKDLALYTRWITDGSLVL